MKAREQSDDLSVVSLFFPCLNAKLMQPCAVGSSPYSPWIYLSEVCRTFVLRDVDLEYEFVQWLANRRMEISVSGILSLELVLIRWPSEGECLSTVHRGPDECLLWSR